MSEVKVQIAKPEDVFVLFRSFECVDCGNEGVLESIHTTLESAMSAVDEPGIAWLQSAEGIIPRWTKHRGNYYVERWPVER